jgi:rhodanese-related sulfurtransferase
MSAASRRTIGDLYAEACSAITRFTPLEARRAAAQGALIIDIRSNDARARDGIVPGSLHVPRTVLEWRIDPDSAWRNPHLGDPARQLILLCDHGCSSALAAASLVQLGLEQTGDVVEGLVGWREAGMPLSAAPPPFDGVPGMGPPDLV